MRVGEGERLRHDAAERFADHMDPVGVDLVVDALEILREVRKVVTSARRVGLSLEGQVIHEHPEAPGELGNHVREELGDAVEAGDEDDRRALAVRLEPDGSRSHGPSAVRGSVARRASLRESNLAMPGIDLANGPPWIIGRADGMNRERWGTWLRSI